MWACSELFQDYGVSVHMATTDFITIVAIQLSPYIQLMLWNVIGFLINCIQTVQIWHTTEALLFEIFSGNHSFLNLSKWSLKIKNENYDWIRFAKLSLLPTTGN